MPEEFRAVAQGFAALDEALMLRPGQSDRALRGHSTCDAVGARELRDVAEGVMNRCGFRVERGDPAWGPSAVDEWRRKAGAAWRPEDQPAA
jgi:hypothetical protein